MRNSIFHFVISFIITALILTPFDVQAQVAESENKRCRTDEEIGSGSNLFNECDWITGANEASVSDVTLTTLIEFRHAGADYIERWTGPGYFVERTYEWGLHENGFEGFKGPCSSGTCYWSKWGWVHREFWSYFRGTLLAKNVGTWLYEELFNGVVQQSRTFNVRGLNLSAQSGANQMGIVDQNLSNPLVLELESFEGIGIEDEVIGWSIAGPKGAKRAAVYGIGSGSETNAIGVDQATIHLGTKPGDYVVTLNNRRMVDQPTFTFTAIDSIEDTNPEQEHPEFEEGVGLNQAQQCDTVGNPIGLSIGNKFQREVDLESTGVSPIEFIRYHNSLGHVSDSFINYWTHTYDRNVEIPVDPRTDPVKVARPDGKKINFTWDGSSYQAYPGIRSALEQTADGWRYTDENLTIENFDADGFLADITDISGRTQVATYNSSNKLTRIVSNMGGSLDFTYDRSERLSTLTDQAGRTWTYRYEILGRLAHVDNPDGTTREYHYEDLRHAYALTGITTENGQRFSYYEYDDQGLATASYHAGNANRVDIQYDTNGDRIVLDPLGNATLYQTRIENKRGLLEGISGPVCSQGCGLTDSQYSFDVDLNVVSKTVYGVTTQYGNYDSKGRPAYTIQAVGTAEEKRIDYEYDPGFWNKITKITEPSVYAGESRITTRSYDFNGNKLSETITGFDPFGQTVSRSSSNTFNGPFGQITSSDGPRTDVSDITTYEYYPNTQAEGPNRARLKTITDPGGLRLRDDIIYSTTGKILSESRPNGVTVNYEYYAGNDRIKSITESGGGLFNRTRWEYYPVGDVQQMSIDDESGDEIITQFSYDKARRLYRVESRIAGSQTNQWVSHEFDAAGNIITETHESRDSPRNDIIIDKVFDAYNRIDTITQGGVTEDYDYDPDGTLATRTDGKQNTTTYSYDAFRRLTTTSQAGQVDTSMTYDVQGNTLSVTDPEGHATRYLYDDLGNLVQQDSPDTGTSSYDYNQSGQLVSQTDARGQSSSFTYDIAGRLIGIDRVGTDYDVTYTFDTCSNGSGRLCDVTSGWGHTIRYGWNALGELASVTSNEGQLKYTYGPQNTLTSIEYPTGRTVNFELDGGGLTKQIRLQIDGLPESILVDDIKYSPLGRPVSWLFANGQRTTIDLDARHRPVSIDVPGVWNWQASQYDDNDNILNIVSTVDGFAYNYDAYDRLTSAVSTADSIAYTYDNVGNRLSRTINSRIETGTFEVGSNRITGYGDTQYILDENGNTSSLSINQSPGKTYVYSSHDRLVEVIDDQTSQTIASYRYDALGQRVTKTTQNESTKFLYGPNGELLVVTDGAGTVLHEYVYLNGQAIVDLDEAQNGPPPATTGEIIIDNSEAHVVGANWQTKSNSAANNGTYLQNRKRVDRGVYWYIDPPGFQGGSHDVFVKWLQPDGEGISTSYDVRVNGEPTHRVIVRHDEHNRGDWVLLGNFDFAPAGGGLGQYVSLTGFNNSFGFEGTFLEADAVKIVPTIVPDGYIDLKFIHNDHLGTPQFATDSSTQIVWSASYKPFGEAAVDEDPDGDGTEYSLNIRFPGQYYDAESGLHYNYFRDYDPGIGRYVESDPIGLDGGLNTFVYAGSNPLKHSDFFGLDSEFCRRPFYPLPIPYARHCFVRYDDGSSSSFGPDGAGSDPAPEWWPESCQATDGNQNDECVKREMNKCTGDQYDFLGFNCCHCVEQAMNACGIGIPVDDWPNWPVNPGPQPGEPGYHP